MVVLNKIELIDFESHAELETKLKEAGRREGGREIQLGKKMPLPEHASQQNFFSLPSSLPPSLPRFR